MKPLIERLHPETSGTIQAKYQTTEMQAYISAKIETQDQCEALIEILQKCFLPLFVKKEDIDVFHQER